MASFMKVRLRLIIIIRTRAAPETGRVFSPAIDSLAFTNTGDISFTDMKMGYSSNGGAIFINQGGDSSLYSNPGDGNISFDHTGNIIFRNLV